MKERPILMCGDMVRAVLEGRKTETRRVLKLPTWAHPNDKGDDLPGDGPMVCHRDSGCLCNVPPPYGQPGDRLWVKETFLNHALAGYAPVWFYRADGRDKPADRKWTPSIFMPRWASRITLEIVSVRVERVQDITEEGAVAEGMQAEKATPIEYWEGYRRDMKDRYGNTAHQQIERTGEEPPPEWMDQPRIRKGERGFNIPARNLYTHLWDFLNSKRDGGKFAWSKNPWVWVIQFKKL